MNKYIIIYPKNNILKDEIITSTHKLAAQLAKDVLIKNNLFNGKFIIKEKNNDHNNRRYKFESYGDEIREINTIKRYFKLIYNNNSFGRYSGKNPLSAA